jgi:hypothetical protein
MVVGPLSLVRQSKLRLLWVVIAVGFAVLAIVKGLWLVAAFFGVTALRIGLELFGFRILGPIDPRTSAIQRMRNRRAGR